MTTEHVTTYYEADHERLDGLFKSFQNLKRTDFLKARELFREFKLGLQRHIIWEEEILFPLFERTTGLTESGPTHVMRMEHRQIGQYLESIHEKVSHQNPNSDEEEQLLVNVLFLHNRKEESILYPAIDRFLTEQERQSIFRAMEAIPEERYTG